MEDLFRLPDIDHVVIVAGDSDYVSLAQRCKRLGRFVVAVGVAGSTSTVLVSACDAFEYYDDILSDADDVEDEGSGDAADRASGADALGDGADGSSVAGDDPYGDGPDPYGDPDDDFASTRSSAPAAPRRVTWMFNDRLGADRGSAAGGDSGGPAGGLAPGAC